MLGSQGGIQRDDGVESYNYPGGWREKISKDQIRKVVIGDGITGIYRLFFQELYNLESVEIGSGVQEIQDSAFQHCSSIKTITLSPDNTGLKIVNKGIYSADGKKLCLYPVADPDQPIIAAGTQIIGSYVFAYSQMKEITIPASVTALSGALFYRCENLVSVSFEKDSQCEMTEMSNVSDDEHGSFEGCKKLQKIEFGENFKWLGPAAFTGCTSLKSIYFGKAFQGFGGSSASTKNFCWLDWGDIPFPALEKIQISKSNSVYKTKNNVVFSKNGKKLYYYPICRKGKVYRIPDSVKTIAKCAFMYNQVLQSVHTGKNTTKISAEAFCYSKKLSKVTFGKKIQTLGDSAFSSCIRLKTAKNLEKVKNLKRNALLCTQINLLTWNMADVTWGMVGKNMTLYVPKTKQKVHWKVIRGKANVKIVKQYPNAGKVTLKIKKKGESTVQVAVGKKKRVCIIKSDKYEG